MKFSIAGLFHAGTWDPHDFLTSRISGWAQDVERGWLRSLDLVMVSTEFHAYLLHRFCPDVRAKVVGCPFYLEPELMRFSRPWGDRDNLVVFPHRLAPEKQPHVFKELKAAYEKRYGVGPECIAMLEGLALGAVPIAPNRLSYPESLRGMRLYETLDEAVEMIHDAVMLPLGHPSALYERWDEWENHIGRVIEECRSL
ncbi:MAG: hypothetical protein P8Y10_16420 [Gemmatimonadales bacterium]